MSEKTDLPVEDSSAVARASAKPSVEPVLAKGLAVNTIVEIQDNGTSQIRARVISLFTYLKELCVLRTTRTRSVANYEQVFWLGEIPPERLCRCIAWHVYNPPKEEPEQVSDVWIQVGKPTLKSSPELPDELDPWVREEQLHDSSPDEPVISDEIPLAMLQSNTQDAESTARASLNDHPEVFEAWVKYIETQWKPWAVEDRRLQGVQKVYNQLFNIYQRQEKLGEQYEVVLGVGLLMWRSPHSGDVKRHIITLRSRIEFDREHGVIRVGPGIDGSEPTLEYDMLEPDDLPNSTDLSAIKGDVAELDGNPWERTVLEKILRGFANAIPSPGEFSATLDHSATIASRPVIQLAPALILRRRTHRSFEEFYAQIIKQVTEGGEIPENIHRIVDIVEEPNNISEEPGNRAAQSTHGADDPELYFPLPANDEQKRIVQYIERHRGVLVQGPPGTGKSHTICNLIAHFLAKGKRVLVTSETPRALEVLRHKLHEDMREIEELGVVWLGSDPKSREALSKSVGGITNRKVEWNPIVETAKISRLEKALDAERREQKKLRDEWVACRNADVYAHSGVSGRYSGTLQQIAMQINAERPMHGWLLDRPAEGAQAEATSTEFLQMLRIHRRLTTALADELRLRLFPQNGLTAPQDFCRLVEAEKQATGFHTQAQDKRGYPGYSHLSSLPRETRGAIQRILDNILVAHDHFARHYLEWVEQAAREILNDQDSVWRHILSCTEDHLAHIERTTAASGTISVSGLEDRRLRVTTEDAEALKNHLEAGKRLGFWILRPKVVRRCRYLLDSVRVDEKACDSVDSLRRLLAWADTSVRLQALSDLWKGITQPPQGSAALQCSAFRNLCRPIAEALATKKQIEEIKASCQAYAGIHFPAWHSDAEIDAFRQALLAADLEEDLNAARCTFDPLAERLQKHLREENAHPTTPQLHEAVVKRDCDAYRVAHKALADIHSWAEQYRFLCSVHARFKKCAPRACATYDDFYGDAVWDTRFSGFEDAWAWAKTDRWLKDAVDRERPKRIARAIEDSVTRERKHLTELAAAKAWQHCIGRLKERERLALIAWAQAVKRIRSGTSKSAETHRETARQKLEECRGAIPAWVMPLYQVVQTIRPQSGLFNVVIIDEASQSGPEALLLNYIADKIIVVGDDKQITPLHAGLGLDEARYFSRMHLRDIPHAEGLLPERENSLFAEAKLRFPVLISLREHFRCMPEIIQFANNEFYTTAPLIPLRQYGFDRLKPIETVHVKEGYRRGSDETVDNPPEAEAIVAQIAQCCEDSAYTGKTFGVICLLGSRQAEVINGRLLQEIGASEMERRRLVCGRPYDFQGDERDVIFLSMVDAPQEGRTCRMIRDPDAERRFNVAASRAKDQIWLFHSATLNDLRPECLRYRLLAYCKNPAVMQPDEIGETTLAELRRMALDPSIRRERKMGENIPGTPFDSWFEVDVFFKIVDRRFRVLPQYPVNTRHIDLVVEGLCGRLAVECDGDEDHGAEQWEKDAIRQRELERCGWTFWRVRGSDFYRDPDGALAGLWETLAKLKITPRHMWDAERKQEEADAAVQEPNADVETRERSPEKVEEEVAWGQVDFDKEPSSIKSTEGRLDRVLEFVRGRGKRPEDMAPCTIQTGIVRVLEGCSNHSCTVKSLTSRVLKQLGLLTRGNPRLEFEKRVMRNLGTLKRKGIVEEYKSKNRRIRLMESSQETMLFR